MRLKAGLILCVALLLVGCRGAATFIKPELQQPIDRAVVDHPPDTQLSVAAEHLNVPTAICFDQDGTGTMFIVEGGIGGAPIHIFGRRIDGSTIEIYPAAKLRVPFVGASFKIYGRIGGIAAAGGKVFVSHRDARDMGVITAFTPDGGHSTIVSEFPAQGDYGITDIAIRTDGRIFFGVGPATNSGVVGPDNADAGWVRRHPNACDISPIDLKLHGLKFTSQNPLAGFFGSDARAFTGPFQSYNINDQTRIKKAADGKANSAIYSISPSGGDLQLECFGIRLPRGLGFEEYTLALFATNDGMEMRGTRPIKDDKDAFVKIAPDAWFGFPDYGSDMNSISDSRFQPPDSVMAKIKSGFNEINPLIDLANSKLVQPNRDLFKGEFPSLSGAAKFDFIPPSPTIAPYKKFRGQAIVALAGDRAPFATSGMPLSGPAGYKVVSVNPDNHKVEDFIFNTKGQPASKLGHNIVALERPCDVKLGPDGSLYILDMGVLVMKDGKEHISERTGRIFRLKPDEEPQRPGPAPEK